MFSRYRSVLRRVVHTGVLYRNFNVGQIRKVPHNISVPVSVGFSLLTLIGLEKKLNAEDELILTIKHCILFIQRNEFDKAEQLLHVALKQAQQMQHNTGITYIYDVMGNLALERKQYDKAKQLFVAVTQRIIADGVSENDLKVIHLSAKLARISHMQKDYTTAQLGFDWCLEKLYDKVKIDPSDVNKQLLAMTEDWYGRLFLDCGKLELGINYIKKSYENMKDIPEVEKEHLIIQLNDIGTALYKVGAIDESIEYLTEAIDLGKTLPDMVELGTVYVNLGRAYLQKQLIEKARKTCGYGWRIAFMGKNDEIKKEAEICLQQIKNAAIYYFFYFPCKIKL
ncbi:tetratricopeptide repeat protein 19 homolog, mitochondrial [Aricia agestis]|uniref:tetratricopeptide repeat protein 19 homolog, mitochondrial n=1 Tax=Aricia agestis TaxID=91739 RepID=UPI001C20716C|nr:tetratricopeptide repeat protein 19 homolog, mitochondrial [Aricia agestis]